MKQALKLMPLASRAFRLRPSTSPTFSSRTHYHQQPQQQLFKQQSSAFLRAHQTRRTPPAPSIRQLQEQQKINRTSSLQPLTLILLATAFSAGTYYIASATSTTTPESTANTTTTTTITTATSSKMSAHGFPEQAPMPAKLDAASLHDQLVSTAATLPPGRPGNLTPEQEIKLKELWGRLLETFGVYTPQAGSKSTTAAPAPAAAKKSGGFFGRGKAEPVDGNDKHGQSKTYQQAIDTMTPQELQAEFYKMVKQDAPDAAVLRYLRARKWDVQAALVMLVSTLHWRAKDMKIDDELMYEGEAGAIRAAEDNTNPTAKKNGADFMGQFRMGKSFVHGFDKGGRPCSYVRVKLHKGGEQSEESIKKFTVFLIETTRFMILPPQDTGSIVFDMTGFSLANMDYTPVKFMIQCFEANYPESLGAIVIYKAPWIFQNIWRIIKGWLDPVVAAKVHFANNIKEMSEYVDPNQVTKECDGNDNYVYQYIEPVEGENAAMADTASREKYMQERKDLVQKFNQNTIQWMEGANVGPQRTRLTLELHLNYFRLDPYIRARSLYDRLGLIKSHNQLGWDKSAVDSAMSQ